MVYILDTNIIRKLLFHFPKKGKVFEDIWLRLEAGIETETYISVDECFNELSGQLSKDNDAFKWISERKRVFKNPDAAETLIIRDLFKNPKMRESIHTKNILANRPSADIYIAAKAKHLGATVVTAEEYKPHSAQLPNICEKLDVPYITFDDFMEQVTQ
jgi:predicted nucleic acid-binding protein